MTSFRELANFACFVDVCGLLQNKIKRIRIRLVSRVSNEERSPSVGLRIRSTQFIKASVLICGVSVRLAHSTYLFSSV